jgi:hypothetical protein
MLRLRARLGTLLPLLAVAAACDADRLSVPTAPVDPPATMPSAAAGTFTCRLEGTGPYTVHYEWSGLSVYQLRLLGGPQDVVVTLKHPMRRSSGSQTLNFPTFIITVWNRRLNFVTQASCATST